MSGREMARARATGGTVEQTGGQSSVRSLFERMAPEIERALPRHMDPDRMIRVALTVVNSNDKLKACKPESLLGALMTCTQIGLEPGPQGHVYFVPYGRDVTFILGYQGMIELARRSGLLLSIAAHTVYQAEVDAGQFSVEYGSVNRLTHRPIIFGDRGAPVAYYASARLKSPSSDATEDVFVVLTKAEVDRFRQRSATQKDKPSGPWNTDYEAMAWKTCIRRLSRWLPQSPELAAAMTHEETVRSDVSVNVVDQAEPRPAEPFGDGAGILGGPTPAELGEGDKPSVNIGDAPEVQDPPYEPGDPSDPADPWANQS